ncbi:MAG: type II toxin-antitoxin system RelB/DinJ family antitoxin [Clostridiales bacterium]|nr:type II toxin-antitoxin system RelB/DinJ family antitoxin [Clostridiales bacterium]
MKVNMNIKVDTEVRDQAKLLFGQLGLDMTTAVNMFLLAAIREKGMPFRLTTVSRYDDEIDKIIAAKLRKAEEQEQAGKLSDFSEAMSELKSKYGI